MSNRPESHRLQRCVHWTLLSGVVLSGAMLLLGLTLALQRGQEEPVGRPPSVPSLLRMAFAGDGVAWLNLGLLVVIATPMFRVLVLAIGWELAGERRFAAVALTVLCLLVVGLCLGLE